MQFFHYKVTYHQHEADLNVEKFFVNRKTFRLKNTTFKHSDKEEKKIKLTSILV